jgi:hypothetical protein
MRNKTPYSQRTKWARTSHTVAVAVVEVLTLATQIHHHHKMTTSSDPALSDNCFAAHQPLSQSGWEAAQEHLQAALQTALMTIPGTLVSRNVRGRNKNKRSDCQTGSGGYHTSQTLSAASAGFAPGSLSPRRATIFTPYNDRWLRQAHTLYQDVMTVRTWL